MSPSLSFLLHSDLKMKSEGAGNVFLSKPCNFPGDTQLLRYTAKSRTQVRLTQSLPFCVLLCKSTYQPEVQLLSKDTLELATFSYEHGVHWRPKGHAVRAPRPAPDG